MLKDLHIKGMRGLGEKTKIYRNSIRLENPQAVQRLLARTINLLNDNMINENRAKAIGYLANILLNSFETVNLEKRIEELESIIEGKKGGQSEEGLN